ncbi:PfkB family carbohydrate kinase [Labrenzia sp. 011]|uniref:PfkB family carbohydrate kinase n=1 Tax=Labrenzia sp. 011 TaxID=2171494 RepID=UPI000D51DD94|nr:PfkB family carbohydrate kinase [Labrenzia sp. 011]PVB59924.1 carbohydrate kinase [Labrenzia sp. 011]
MSSSSARPVISIGAIHLDTIAHATRTVRRETSTPAAFSSNPGGVAANIARALCRLGIDTSLVGALGDDSAARMLTGRLTGEGLTLACVTRPAMATGQYLALHDPDGSLAAACVDDRILSEAPADLFDQILEELMARAPRETLWFLDANLPERMLVRVAAMLDGRRMIANAVSEAKASRLTPVLASLDCLLLNRGEAAALTGLSGDAPQETLADALSGTGLHSWVLTGGRDDILVARAGSLTRFTPPAVDIVDVTGAGDALAAGTLAALARGYALAEAVPFGLAAASLTLRATGALAANLSWDALNDI